MRINRSATQPSLVVGAVFALALAAGSCGDDGTQNVYVGALWVNEIMADPAQVADTNGEWFEIYNSSPSPIDLMGLTVRDDGSDAFTVNTSLVIPSGGYVTFGRSTESGINGGASVSYAYSGFTLNDTGDQIILIYGSVQIDRVAYHSAFPIATGAAMSLQLGGDQTGNDFAVNWCSSSVTYGAGDLGTPGAENPICPP